MRKPSWGIGNLRLFDSVICSTSPLCIIYQKFDLEIRSDESEFAVE